MGELQNGDHKIVFYTAFSPNGHKIAVTLEELGLSYEMVHVNLPAIQHKEPWFLEINPNGRIPALTDTLPDGTPISLFESGSIQQYLVDRYDTEHKISYPRGTKEFYQTNNWVGLPNCSYRFAVKFLVQSDVGASFSFKMPE